MSACAPLVRDGLDQLHDRWRRQHAYLIERAGGDESVSERLRVLERVELHPSEDLVWVVNPAQHEMALRDLLAPDRIRIEPRLEVVKVVDLEVMNHESQDASSSSSCTQLGY